MRIWSAKGNNIVSNDGILIEIPIINSATGVEQIPDSNEAYEIAKYIANALNDREHVPLYKGELNFLDKLHFKK